MTETKPDNTVDVSSLVNFLITSTVSLMRCRWASLEHDVNKMFNSPPTILLFVTGHRILSFLYRRGGPDDVYTSAGEEDTGSSSWVARVCLHTCASDLFPLSKVKSVVTPPYLLLDKIFTRYFSTLSYLPTT